MKAITPQLYRQIKLANMRQYAYLTLDSTISYLV